MADLGTIAVLAWSGEQPEGQGDLACLLAYSLGDAEGGPDATAAAVRRLLEDHGLPIGGPVVDGTRRQALPVGLLVEAGQAVVTLPNLTAQCTVPPQWLSAVERRGYAHFVFTARAWPDAEPGRAVDPQALAAFAGDEETLLDAAHCLLPARGLRG